MLTRWLRAPRLVEFSPGSSSLVFLISVILRASRNSDLLPLLKAPWLFTLHTFPCRSCRDSFVFYVSFASQLTRAVPNSEQDVKQTENNNKRYLSF